MENTIGFQPLDQRELDASFAEGLLEAWINKLTDQKQKDGLALHLKALADGKEFYRQKYIGLQEDFQNLTTKYNQLVALSSQYLGMINQQRQQIDQLLADSQREFHQHDHGGEG